MQYKFKPRVCYEEGYTTSIYYSSVNFVNTYSMMYACVVSAVCTRCSPFSVVLRAIILSWCVTDWQCVHSVYFMLILIKLIVKRLPASHDQCSRDTFLHIDNVFRHKI